MDYCGKNGRNLLTGQNISARLLHENANNGVYFMALPQIEWVNISIEPANTPLSVIPAEAGIQCLLAPGHWIPAKNVQE